MIDDENDDDGDDSYATALAERLAFAAMSHFARVKYATIEKRYQGRPVGEYWLELAKQVLRDRASPDEPELAQQLPDRAEKPN